jgi:hypothetical protein
MCGFGFVVVLRRGFGSFAAANALSHRSLYRDIKSTNPAQTFSGAGNVSITGLTISQ